jgi:hypothetical protein
VFGHRNRGHRFLRLSAAVRRLGKARQEAHACRQDEFKQRREEAHCDACHDARTDAQATITSTQDSNSDDGIMETPIDKEREAVRSLKEELTVCREQLATLKRLLSECIQNKYYDESTCSPSWLKGAREAIDETSTGKPCT